MYVRMYVCISNVIHEENGYPNMYTKYKITVCITITYTKKEMYVYIIRQRRDL